MAYTMDRTISGVPLGEAEDRARRALAGQGFGVLTEIDVQATLKQKLDVAIPGYRILGACNPGMAHRAMGLVPRVGGMLPCNVILREVGDAVELSAIDPVASMQAVGNPELSAVAGQVRDLLANTVTEL